VFVRIRSGESNPLGLEAAGYALLDLAMERRGNLFTDEVYRCTKAAEVPVERTRVPTLVATALKHLPTSHKFDTNDLIVLTLQPVGKETVVGTRSISPLSEEAVSIEARVLNVGPTYMDVAIQAGLFDATFGAPAEDNGRHLRFRADRYFSAIPFQRMVDALSQISCVGSKDCPSKAKNDVKTKGSELSIGNAIDEQRIAMDELFQQVLVSTFAYSDASSPWLRDSKICDIEKIAKAISEPATSISIKTTQQVLKTIAENAHGRFRSLNAAQIEAVKAALTRRMTLIQGISAHVVCSATPLYHHFLFQQISCSFCFAHLFFMYPIYQARLGRAKLLLQQQWLLVLFSSVATFRHMLRY
jgi:hypothetical protein